MESDLSTDPSTSDPFDPPGDVSALFREGLPDMERVLLSLLNGGPATGWELARAIEGAAPGLLERKEGYLYPVLAQLAREGRVFAAWREGAGGQPLHLYARSREALGPEEGGMPTFSSAAIPMLERTAHDVTRTIPGAMERTSARSEVRDHLERSFSEYLRMGVAPERATRLAVSDLGDTWKIRTDLGRVHKGKSVVVFPTTFSERLRSAAIYDL
ncbi:MAG: helix-turn-helix transcriptional regulator, partial [Planctomycetota bacterium]